MTIVVYIPTTLHMYVKLNSRVMYDTVLFENTQFTCKNKAQFIAALIVLII